MTSIAIPSSVTYIAGQTFRLSSLESINVDSSNENYSSEDGILFNKDKTELIRYPPKKEETNYTITSGVTYIYSTAFSECMNLKSIKIPSSVTEIGEIPFCQSLNLENITVDSSNKNYSDKDGVLFNKDKTELICCPAGRKDTYTVPSEVTSIGDRAFQHCYYLKSIIIPDNVTKIDDNSFNMWNNTIYCKSNSTAETYAKENEIDYVIDNDGPAIELAQEASNIVVTATDSVVGLADEAYSIDGIKWYESNKIAVDKSGEYTVYVRDKLGNTNQEKITVDIDEPTITNIAVDGYKITVTATDNIALADEAYSIDGTNYQASNVFTVSKAGTYTIYVKDSSNNIATKSVIVNDTSGNIAKKVAVVGSNKDVTEEKQEEQITEEDDSQSKSKLPQTGGKSIIIGIIAILVCAGFFRRKMKKTGI